MFCSYVLHGSALKPAVPEMAREQITSTGHCAMPGRQITILQVGMLLYRDRYLILVRTSLCFSLSSVHLPFPQTTKFYWNQQFDVVFCLRRWTQKLVTRFSSNRICIFGRKIMLQEGGNSHPVMGCSSTPFSSTADSSSVRLGTIWAGNEVCRLIKSCMIYIYPRTWTISNQWSRQHRNSEHFAFRLRRVHLIEPLSFPFPHHTTTTTPPPPFPHLLVHGW